jgi:hypothetical protein
MSRVSSHHSFVQLFFRRGTDPLVGHGRHFGRTVHALTSMHVMINNGILRMGELADQEEDAFSQE